MSNARTELFIYMAAAFATAAGLFTLQQVYASYIDMSYHAELKQHGAYENIVALRDTEAKALETGKMPIEHAKELLAQRGRGGFGSIAAVQSDDLSAVSGWIRLHSFKPAIAHQIRTPRAPVVEAAPAPVEVAPAPAPAPVVVIKHPPIAPHIAHKAAAHP